MTRSPNLYQFARRYILDTALATILMVAMLSIVCSAVLWELYEIDITLAAFGALGVIGWGIYYGQELVVEKESESVPFFYEEEVDGGENQEGGPKVKIRQTIKTILYAFAAGLYHNWIIVIGASIASGVAESGLPVGAIFLAFIYPTYDSVTSQRNIPLSFGGFAAFLLLLAGKVKHLDTWSSLRIDRFTIDVVDHIYPRRGAIP